LGWPHSRAVCSPSSTTLSLHPPTLSLQAERSPTPTFICPPNARRRVGLSIARGALVSAPVVARRSLSEATPAARRLSEAGRPREGCRWSSPTPSAPPPPHTASSSTARHRQLRRTTTRCSEVRLPKVHLRPSGPPPQGLALLQSASPFSESPTTCACE